MAAFVLLGIFVAPLIILLIQQDTGNLGWIQPPTFVSLFAQLRQLAGNGGDGLLAGFALLVVFACLPLPKTSAVAGQLNGKRWLITFLLLWSIVSIAMMFLISLAKPILVERYMIMSLPPLVLLAAHGICKLLTRFEARKIFSLMLLLMLAVSLWGDARYFRKRSNAVNEWRPAARYLTANYQAGDGIIMNPSWSHFPLLYYAGREAAKTFDNSRIEGLTSNTVTDENIKRLLDNHRRIWLVAYDPATSAVPNKRQYAKDLETLRTVLSGKFASGEVRDFPGWSISTGSNSLRVEMYNYQAH